MKQPLIKEMQNDRNQEGGASGGYGIKVPKT
jgi:hypothetical protein